jgi:hypothetical protein
MLPRLGFLKQNPWPGAFEVTRISKFMCASLTTQPQTGLGFPLPLNKLDLLGFFFMLFEMSLK